MTLRIGTRNGAFTLVEVMVATAILALGAVLIHETFFVSMNAFDYYSDYLYLVPLIDEKIWQAESNIRRFGPSAYVQPKGSFIRGSKGFSWNMSSNVISETQDLQLYRISFDVSWRKGERNLSIKRDTYAFYREDES